jgi:hypothetical protein
MFHNKQGISRLTERLSELSCMELVSLCNRRKYLTWDISLELFLDFVKFNQINDQSDCSVISTFNNGPA